MSDRVFITATSTCHNRPAADDAVVQQAAGVLMDWYDIPPLEAEA